MATNIHHPTDSTLLHDGVRGLSRALETAKTLRQDVAAVAQEASTDYAQQARAKRKRIMEVARQRGEAATERRKTTYRDLIDSDHHGRGPCHARAAEADGPDSSCAAAHRGDR